MQHERTTIELNDAAWYSTVLELFLLFLWVLLLLRITVYELDIVDNLLVRFSIQPCWEQVLIVIP